MPDADLDIVIRKLAKKQHGALTAAIKARRDHFNALAAKAKTPDAKARFKQSAKDAMEHGSAAAKRLQMSADNAADAYARAMRKAAESGPMTAKTSSRTKVAKAADAKRSAK